MFVWARDGVVPPVPMRRMTVGELEVLDIGTVDASELQAAARTRIPRVRGDFRQEEVLARWSEVLAAGGHWTAARLRIACSSGTYVRSLAHELGRRVGTGAFLLDLRRVRVGPWRISDAAVIRPPAGA